MALLALSTIIGCRFAENKEPITHSFLGVGKANQSHHLNVSGE